MQDEHRPRAFADDEVALPMAGLAAAFNGLRTIMDRRSILDGVARGPGATRATAFVAPRGTALLTRTGPQDGPPCAFSVSLEVAGALIFLNRHYGEYEHLTRVRGLAPDFSWEGAEPRSGSVYRLLRRPGLSRPRVNMRSSAVGLAAKIS